MCRTESAVAIAASYPAERAQVGECLTCSIGLAPNVFLGKFGPDLRKPDGLLVITLDKLPDMLLHLELQNTYGIRPRMEERLKRGGIATVAELRNATPPPPVAGKTAWFPPRRRQRGILRIAPLRRQGIDAVLRMRRGRYHPLGLQRHLGRGGAARSSVATWSPEAALNREVAQQ
jgi:hypothetical protein